jgi:UDP-N-acetylmuramate--alanine ligase
MNRSSQNSYYFIGVGGVGMSALARLCKAKGHIVYGYDRTATPLTYQLEQEGITVGYDASLDALTTPLTSKEIQVVYTAAISSSHPQLAFYLKQGNRVVKRAQFLAEICGEEYVMAVAGTHGKTTTSSILAHILLKTQQSFTAILGGFLNEGQNNLIQKGNDIFVVEADEYDRSFLHLYPSIACITSMEADHLDIYKTEEEFKEAFVQFSNQVKKELVVAYGVPLSGWTYGVDVNADYKAFNLCITPTGYSFDLKTPSGVFEKVRINLLGKHNVENALGAIAMADLAGLELESVLSALSSFKGVYRRMNVYEWEQAIVLDDYAHHPTEIRSVYQTLKSIYPNQKNCVVFQPHLFSRTRDFMEEFATVLGLFDEVILLDIYPAREEPIEGIDSNTLLKKIKNKQKKIIQKQEIKTTLQHSDAGVFALLGAGDIGEEIQRLKTEFTQNETV